MEIDQKLDEQKSFIDIILWFTPKDAAIVSSIKREAIKKISIPNANQNSSEPESSIAINEPES